MIRVKNANSSGSSELDGLNGASQTYLLSVADMAVNASALHTAAGQKDFDEARFRAILVVEKANLIGAKGVADAAESVLAHLGEFGSAPTLGYGEVMRNLSEALSALYLPNNSPRE